MAADVNVREYVFGWLVGYSGLLGPVTGIMVADYFLLRHTKLDVTALYQRGGLYHYRGGVNPRAIAALVVGILRHWLGRLCRHCVLYDYAWFVGFFLSGALYVLLMQLSSVCVTHGTAPEPL